MMSLVGFPAVSSCQHSGYAKDKGGADEKIPGDIAQVQSAAAGYGCGGKNGKNREEGQYNTYDFAEFLFHVGFLHDVKQICTL